METKCKCGHAQSKHKLVSGGLRMCGEQAPETGPYSGGMMCKCLNYEQAEADSGKEAK